MARNEARRGAGSPPANVVTIQGVSAPEMRITLIAARKFPLASAKMVGWVTAVSSTKSNGRQHQRRGPPAAHDMLLQNKINIRRRIHVVPDTFGVDDDTWTVLATIKASRGVDANPLNTQFLRTRLHIVAQLLRSALGAAAFGVPIRPPVRANKHMKIKEEGRIAHLPVTHSPLRSWFCAAVCGAPAYLRIPAQGGKRRMAVRHWRGRAAALEPNRAIPLVIPTRIESDTGKAKAKQFFFEKKNQKTFGYKACALPQCARQWTNVFASFSKKKRFLASYGSASMRLA
jgi:hypothetical protein